jgi:hypothetical protein
MVKGNSLIQNRVIGMTNGKARNPACQFETPCQSFAATLEVHLMLCDWAAENWRWYIDFLDRQISAATADTLTYSPTEEEKLQEALQNRPNMVVAPPPPRKSTLEAIQRVFTGKPRRRPEHATEMSDFQPAARMPVLERQGSKVRVKTFRKLQQLQEKALEISLIFELNTKVLNELSQYYLDALKAESFPDDLRTAYTTAGLRRFEERIAGLTSDFRMQQARVDRLLRLLKERKELVCPPFPWIVSPVCSRRKGLTLEQHQDILNHENVIANRELSYKAQLSADRMEKMTASMRQIAEKTEQETVSMRIVTIVTLFYLPGTFISVSGGYGFS